MAPATIKLDVSDSLPSEGEQVVTCWVFPPRAVGPTVPVLFCLPGGTYTKAYWHLDVPGRSSYSFAEHMAEAGMLVIAVDHLGTGESTPHVRALDLTPDVVAASNSAAFTEIVQRAAKGSLLPGLEPLNLGRAFGVGHSMGAMLAIYQQSLFESFDALACLGYGTAGPIGTRVCRQASRCRVASPYSKHPRRASGTARRPSRGRRHTCASTSTGTTFRTKPRPPTISPPPTFRESAGVFRSYRSSHPDHARRARRVRCPVFIGLGERDSTAGHHSEPASYASSPDVSLFVLPRSGHRHDTAGTRLLLWDRMRAWIDTIAAADGSDDAGDVAWISRTSASARSARA